MISTTILRLQCNGRKPISRVEVHGRAESKRRKAQEQLAEDCQRLSAKSSSVRRKGARADWHAEQDRRALILACTAAKRLRRGSGGGASLASA